MPKPSSYVILMAAMSILAGCHQTAAPTASDEQVQAARQQAQREVADAKTEAAKDVKSAVKTMGPSSRGVADAKIVGTYDITMAQADGDHAVATTTCLTLPADRQQPCQSQADADYAKIKADAKATRMARQR